MASVGQKLDTRQFEIAGSVVMSVAVLLGCTRVYIKATKFHRLYIDDFLFILATVLLVAGTITVFLCLPYNQTAVNVSAGLQAPPPDLTYQLDHDVKFQDAFNFLLSGSIFSVKFSFLFFFRLLMQRTGKLQVWWWIIFVFTIPCAVICMCIEFVSCPAFGDRITTVCISDSALARQKAILYTVVVLDIFTDVLLISIPILLLWNVKINLRRKLGLGSLLCLSVFAIITNIIRVVGHDLTNGQDDLVWLFFWLQIEACIAVMANSATAFRSLFARGTATVKPSAHDGGEGGAGDRSPVLKKTRSSKKKTASSSSGEKPQVGLTSLPTVAFSGLRSWMMTDPFADEELDDAATLTNAAGGTTENLPMQIRVVNSLDVSSTQRTQSTNQDFNEKARSSHEGFI